MSDKLVNRNVTHTGEAERKESSWRLGPVSDVSIEDSNANDADDNCQVDNGKHNVERGRYLDILQHKLQWQITSLVKDSGQRQHTGRRWRR